MVEKGLATLGGGCFWCLEASFEMLEGVEQSVSGYAGGSAKDPTYRQVCEGTTGHAEVVQLTFDPGVISYRELLDVFFTVHDPTTLNRQGADVGTQYRSVILYHDDEQKAAAESAIKDLIDGGVYSGHPVTQVVPVDRFYVAEDYHQGYYRNNPTEGYCRAVVSPKVAKMRKAWAGKLKADE